MSLANLSPGHGGCARKGERIMLKEFKAFIMRGNVLDLAIGIVIGAAFGRIVTSFVNDLLMPPIGLLLGRIDFSNLFVALRGGPYPSLAAAKAAGAPTFNYGLFLNTVIDFLIVAFVIFLIVRAVNRMAAHPEPTSTTKPCPYCFTTIAVQAVRCPNCTSELKAAR
jgi:large conductance mechanosensitive channel